MTETIPSEDNATLQLESLHERHIGLTQSLGGSFYEAASVCFDRHHESPIDIKIDDQGSENIRTAEFTKPDDRILNAWANEIDTTEFGAYGVCLAVLEAEKQLVAVKRAETLTGADYYVAPVNTEFGDLEDAYRFEVSGINEGGNSVIRSRLKAKVEQTKAGASNLPAIASVVGFKEKTVLIQKVVED